MAQDLCCTCTSLTGTITTVCLQAVEAEKSALLALRREGRQLPAQEMKGYLARLRYEQRLTPAFVALPCCACFGSFWPSHTPVLHILAYALHQLPDRFLFNAVVLW